MTFVGLARCDQPNHRCRRKVDAGGKELRHLLDDFHGPCLTLCGVDHAIRFERNERVDVIGCDDAGRLAQPTKFGGVTPDLVRAGGVYSDQFQIGPFDERFQRMDPDIARRKLNYSAHPVFVLDQ